MSKIFRSPLILVALLAAVLVVIAGGYFLYHRLGPSAQRSVNVLAWLNHPQNHPEWAIQAGQRCGKSPFLLPTNGFVGYLWLDSFQIGHRHQGIDIFGGTDLNQTPVVAAYPGYLTRQADWKSSLIIRIPDDPLQPGRQIWTYYTHMADPQGNSFISAEFPPGTSEVYVEAGTLLGYQGNYSGNPNNPTGVHLHLSIVKDSQGKYLNELDYRNTLDPSPYLGLLLNASQNPRGAPVCK